MQKQVEVSFSELFKDLESEGLPYKNIAFKSSLKDDVIHVVDGWPCGQPKNQKKRTWGEVHENNWRICMNCSCYISHPGGWTTLGDSMGALELARRIGLAVQNLMDSNHNVSMQSLDAVSLIQAAEDQQVGRRFVGAFNDAVPKGLRGYLAKQFALWGKMVEQGLDEPSRKMLAAVLALENSTPTSILPKAAEALASQDGNALIYLNGVEDIAAAVEGGRENEGVEGSPFSRASARSASLLQLVAEPYFKKGRRTAQVPLVVASALHRRTALLTLYAPETLTEASLETLEVLCRDQEISNLYEFAEAYESARLLEAE